MSVATTKRSPSGKSYDTALEQLSAWQQLSPLVPNRRDEWQHSTRGSKPTTHLGRSCQELTALKEDLAGGRRHGPYLSQKSVQNCRFNRKFRDKALAAIGP
jgi:hypothetical protein